MKDTVPGEIFDRILDHLHASPITLRVCMLVSREWVPTCRLHLYTKEHLVTAAREGVEWMVQLLLQRKDIDVNAESTRHNGNALLWATATGNIGVLKMLLAVDGIEVNVRGDADSCPLSIAVYAKQRQVAKLLLEHKDIKMIIQTSLYQYGLEVLSCILTS